ncbi:adenylosuccinate synthase [Butyrivibrio sp. X503]|uniref:adenylosuccinate synthetase n=1 Tax=Butyrivibrio sp. X503 TaxID=2364878 RepID=UPI000EA83C23|nr:adenylosuccinate synthetase [Butyrivibrio sp. X503]RKM54273.1 adenylosuccinate synthase [Butyrivibrio sp. X503]
MKAIAVIGKNFGDEGKGLACASLAQKVKNTLIIKHNGGGQAGHTVEEAGGKRFVHHQIGSGAEFGADTLLAETFLADLYQLGKELEEFKSLYGFAPRIYAEKDTKITVIDDVLRNMFIESARGKERHGSCGMGIDECQKRNAHGYAITMQEVSDMTAKDLFQRLKTIRSEYGSRDLQKIKEKFETNNPGVKSEYYEMLTDDEVLASFSEHIKEGIEAVTIIDASKDMLEKYDRLIFETGQGLLLDVDYELYAPHLTSSKTGLHNIALFLDKREMALDEVIYVTRSYVTRHGNGPLPCEVKRDELPGVGVDLTNVTNEWQGSIRYAKHESIEAFAAPIKEDLKSVENSKSTRNTSKALLLTHLNETNDMVYFEDTDISADELSKELTTAHGFDRVYTSHSCYDTDI